MLLAYRRSLIFSLPLMAVLALVMVFGAVGQTDAAIVDYYGTAPPNTCGDRFTGAGATSVLVAGGPGGCAGNRVDTRWNIGSALATIATFYSTTPYGSDMQITGQSGAPVNIYVRDRDGTGGALTTYIDLLECTNATCSAFSVLDTQTYANTPNNNTVNINDISQLSGIVGSGNYIGFAVRVQGDGSSTIDVRWADDTAAEDAIFRVDETVACTDPDAPNSLAITAPADGGTVSGSTYTVQVQVNGEDTPASMANMSATIAGTTLGTCDVTNDTTGWSWNGGTSRWEYSWDINACGNPADGGITIDVSGDEPDCNTTLNAPQITNVTIDNTCADPDPATLTITDPTSGSTISGNYTIQVTVGGTEANPENMANMSMTTSGTTGCDVTNDTTGWTYAGAGVWEYSWNTIACGNPAENPILIDVSGEDPDCSDLVNAPQITNITVDNTGPVYGLGSCGSCHTYPPADGPRDGATGAVVGSHSVSNHTSGTCSDCHVAPATETSADFDHRNKNIEMTSPIFGQGTSWYDKDKSGTQTGADSTFAQSNTPTLGNCNSTYCHSRGIGGTSNVGEDRPIDANTSPDWGGSIADCDGCHGYEGGATDGQPNYANGLNMGSGTVKANSHTSHSADCSICHNATTTDGTTITTPANHGNELYTLQAKAGYSFTYAYNVAGGTCNTISCHGNGNAQWGVTTVDCTSCHNVAIGSRRAIVPEFGMTWSHDTAVDANDCGVCHMEGATSAGQTTGKTDPAYHANGNVELRDPDTGTTIKNVVFNNGTNSYDQEATDATFAQFSRDLSSNALEDPVEAIQINLCLKCHDTDGASAVWAPGGSATNPFAASPAVTVLDVNTHFDPSNSSYHPIRGRQNNNFADADTMLAPWQFNKAAGDQNNLIDGYLISCWDCHAPDGTASTVTLTSTVTAHGGASTIRGTVFVEDNTTGNLCLICHDRTDYSTNPPGQSAWGGAPDSDAEHDHRGDNFADNCQTCHSSTETDPGRPTRAEDAHGYEGVWPDWGTQNGYAYSTYSQPSAGGARQYGFMRNTELWYGWVPRYFNGSQNTIWGCVHRNTGTCGGRSEHTDNSITSYTPGGAY